MSLTVSVCGVSLLLLLHFVGAKPVSDLQVSLPELSAGVNVSFYNDELFIAESLRVSFLALCRNGNFILKASLFHFSSEFQAAFRRGDQRLTVTPRRRD